MVGQGLRGSYGNVVEWSNECTTPAGGNAGVKAPPMAAEGVAGGGGGCCSLSGSPSWRSPGLLGQASLFSPMRPRSTAPSPRTPLPCRGIGLLGVLLSSAVLPAALSSSVRLPSS